MFAAAVGGSLLLVASPAEAFASDLDSPSTTPNSEASAVSESSPADAALPEQTTTEPLAVADAEALAAQAEATAAAKATADAKSAALAKKKAAAKKRAAEAKKPINIAKKYIGVRYKRGGTSPTSGLDCSGFTRYVYEKAGKSIPRTSSAQRHAGKTISRKYARPGDLVWFSDFRHVAIYAGNGYIIDAPKPGKKVTMRKLWTSHVKYIRVAA
jgi:cell wall-associated NlpC family hydrolase